MENGAQTIVAKDVTMAKREIHLIEIATQMQNEGAAGLLDSSFCVLRSAFINVYVW